LGSDGVNREDDVLVVQALLNDHVPALGLPPLGVDGDAGDNTVRAIEASHRCVRAVLTAECQANSRSSTSTP
jgi:hypothetical protein